MEPNLNLMAGALAMVTVFLAQLIKRLFKASDLGAVVIVLIVAVFLSCLESYVKHKTSWEDLHAAFYQGVIIASSAAGFHSANKAVGRSRARRKPKGPAV